MLAGKKAIKTLARVDKRVDKRIAEMKKRMNQEFTAADIRKEFVGGLIGRVQDILSQDIMIILREGINELRITEKQAEYRDKDGTLSLPLIEVHDIDAIYHARATVKRAATAKSDEIINLLQKIIDGKGEIIVGKYYGRA